MECWAIFVSLLLVYCSPLQANAAFSYLDVWSSPTTWLGGTLPEEGEMVVIKENQTILLDVSTPVLSMLLIQGCTL